MDYDSWKLDTPPHYDATEEPCYSCETVTDIDDLMEYGDDWLCFGCYNKVNEPARIIAFGSAVLEIAYDGKWFILTISKMNNSGQIFCETTQCKEEKIYDAVSYIKNELQNHIKEFNNLRSKNV